MVWMSLLAQDRGCVCVCVGVIRTEGTEHRYSHLLPLPTAGLLRQRQHCFCPAAAEGRGSCSRRRGRARFPLQSGRFKGCIIKRVLT